MTLADLYVCPICERPLEAVGVVLQRMGKPLGRRARRMLARQGLRPPRVRWETRRKLECGHSVHIDKRPVFRNWYSPQAPVVVRHGRPSNYATVPQPTLEWQ